jgi:hypothetical protein
MRTPTTATTPTNAALQAMTDTELRTAIADTQSALRTAFARRRWVCDTGDRLDALVREGDRRGIL